MQADLTDQPAQIPDLVRRFEGGADIVVGEQVPDIAAPVRVRRFRRLARWITKTFARVPGVPDPLGSFRLLRLAVLRDAIRAAGDHPVVAGEGWGVHLDLLQATVPHARRVETVAQTPRFDLRLRESRVRPLADAFRLLRFSRSSRARRPQLRLAGPG